jgi:subtilase family serine protease
VNRYHRVSAGVVTAAALAVCVAAAPAAGTPATSPPHGPAAVAVPQRPGPPGVLVAQHPLMEKVRGYTPDGRPVYVTGAPGGYTAGELRAYLRLRGTGAGQTVAIVDAYDNPYAAGDLNTYSAQFGLPRTCPAGQAAQAGQRAAKFFSFRRLHPFGIGGIDVGWALEESLDIEMVHALAPLASIDLVEAKNDETTSMFKALGYAAGLHAVVISNSYGFGKEFTGETGYDHYCQLTTAVCVYATGDSGHPGGYPAYNPSVIAAGGTTLTLTSSGTVTAETAWSGGGGGVSKYEPRPPYQSATINPYPNRGIPDVSFDANPDTGVAVYSTVNGGWYEVGGTSVAAPAWSGILADADQLRAAAGTGPLTAAGYQAQRALYGLAEGLGDITKGSNGGCGKVCQAGPGYDFVTGLGSPRPGIDTALAAAQPKEAR